MRLNYNDVKRLPRLKRPRRMRSDMSKRRKKRRRSSSQPGGTPRKGAAKSPDAQLANAANEALVHLGK